MVTLGLVKNYLSTAAQPPLRTIVIVILSPALTCLFFFGNPLPACVGTFKPVVLL